MGKVGDRVGRVACCVLRISEKSGNTQYGIRNGLFSGLLITISLLLLTGCSVILPVWGGGAATPTLWPMAAVPTLGPTPTLAATPIQLPATSTRLPTPTVVQPTVAVNSAAFGPPTETATPDPYAALTIANLSARIYGWGELQIVETWTGTAAFNRYLIVYPSDGLSVYGFMDVPVGSGPFPVALVLHGYMETADYQVQTYTTGYADALAQAGYLVIHSNYRNHPPSDEGPNEFRVGYAVDVLNLISLVQNKAGWPGPLQAADGNRIYLFGHSMGGGIALRTLTVSPAIRAAVLYGSMSGDEYQNFERIYDWSNGREGERELQTPLGDLVRISPIYHLERITAAVAIHHGTADATVPPEWSADLCRRLQELGKTAECYDYPGQPHNFTPAGVQLLMERTIKFFGEH